MLPVRIRLEYKTETRRPNHLKSRITTFTARLNWLNLIHMFIWFKSILNAKLQMACLAQIDLYKTWKNDPLCGENLNNKAIPETL